MKDSYCSYCGQAFAAEQPWPRKCARCGNLTFRNPKPVVVVVQPVDDGVALILRNVEPQRGKWALPGGYIDFGERWEEAAARELEEETGISADPGAAVLMRVENGTDGQTLLLFCRFPRITAAALPALRDTAEISGRMVATPETLDAVDFAFLIHRRIIAEFFERKQP
jgi:ADP-ribose pyrophosphatase YjhB (NUDIX family)